MATLDVDGLLGENSPGRLVRRVHKLLERRMQSRFSETDQTFEEWMALKLISDGLVETAGDLARDFNIGTGACTRLIDALEAKGFVERDRTGEDRRVVLLKLTDKGRAHYRAKAPDMLECWNDLLRDFDEAEVGEFIRLLGKLQSAF